MVGIIWVLAAQGMARAVLQVYSVMHFVFSGFVGLSAYLLISTIYRAGYSTFRFRRHGPRYAPTSVDRYIILFCCFLALGAHVLEDIWVGWF
jgi:hypothetical protein